MIKAELYTDGGSRGNPGPAGIGGVLKLAGRKTVELSKYIGRATNNQAEYRAFIAGLKLAQKNKVNDLTCYLDSELIVKQIKGEYRVKDAGLKVLWQEAKEIISLFEKVTVRHVKREKNEQADKLVNIALDNEIK